MLWNLTKGWIPQIIDDIEGATYHVDDILVHGETKEIHDTRVKEVLKILSVAGIALDFEKCSFNLSEVTFLGRINIGKRRETKSSKVAAIWELKE